MTSSSNVARGYAFEYAIAYHLEGYSQGKAHISHSDQQIDLSNTRREYYRRLEERHYYDMFIDLDDKAKHIASLLPVAHGEILFVETTNNDGEVYDVLYTDQVGDTVKGSCKTREVHDKTYSLSSDKYHLPRIMDILSVDLPGYTYSMVRSKTGVFHQVLQAVYDDIKTPEMLKLIDEHVLGNGGFYKTIPDGTLRYYPINNHNLNIRDYVYNPTEQKAVHCVVDMMDDDGIVIQSYRGSIPVTCKNNTESVVAYKNGFIDGLHLGFVTQPCNARVIF